MDTLISASTLLGVPAFLLFAQANGIGESMSGNSGWVGTGLLGLVLSWLLFVHLPAKDKQIRDLLETKDQQLEIKDKHQDGLLKSFEEKITLLSDKFGLSAERGRTEFKESLRMVVDHCARENEHLTTAFNREMEATVKALDANTQTLVTLRQVLGTRANTADPGGGSAIILPGGNKPA